MINPKRVRSSAHFWSSKFNTLSPDLATIATHWYTQIYCTLISMHDSKPIPFDLGILLFFCFFIFIQPQSDHSHDTTEPGPGESTEQRGSKTAPVTTRFVCSYAYPTKQTELKLVDLRARQEPTTSHTTQTRYHGSRPTGSHHYHLLGWALTSLFLCVGAMVGWFKPARGVLVWRFRDESLFSVTQKKTFETRIFKLKIGHVCNFFYNLIWNWNPDMSFFQFRRSEFCKKKLDNNGKNMFKRHSKIIS